MKVCTQGISALVLVLFFSVGVCKAQPLQALGIKVKHAQTQAGKHLPESELLIENDSLFPTQSRSQAMSLETETGHLSPAEDAVLIPMLRRRQQLQIEPRKSLRQKPVSGPLIRNY